MEEKICGVNAIDLFSAYMNIIGIPSLEPESDGDPRFIGKTLGLVNGSPWISLWGKYFGKKIIPGVKIVQVGNYAVQYNFMKAYSQGKEVPPEINKHLFAEYATQLAELVGVDAIMITCSTMNRSYPVVQKAMDKFNIPVVQIDMPMMEQAVNHGGKVLVVATHGPTIENTRLLLQETSERLGKPISFTGANILEAYENLGIGKIREHNESIAYAIKEAQKNEKIDIVVLAQLSMAVFKLSYPDCEREFGIPVLTSAECGFNKVKEIFLEK